MEIGPERQLGGVIEPWRCSHCKTFMFNRDAQGNPCEGAPMPLFWSTKFPKVCKMCYETAIAASTQYMRDLSEKEADAEAARKRQIDKLSGKNDYFTGNPS